MSSKYRVTKGFKFHARPQTGAYSCYCIVSCIVSSYRLKNSFSQSWSWIWGVFGSYYQVSTMSMSMRLRHFLSLSYGAGLYLNDRPAGGEYVSKSSVTPSGLRSGSKPSGISFLWYSSCPPTLRRYNSIAVLNTLRQLSCSNNRNHTATIVYVARR